MYQYGKTVDKHGIIMTGINIIYIKYMNNNINYLYIILCSLSFTLFYFAYKFASNYISNIHLIILQYFILSAFFIIYIIFKHKEFIKEVNLRTIGYASVLGLTSIFSAILLYNVKIRIIC